MVLAVTESRSPSRPSEQSRKGSSPSNRSFTVKLHCHFGVNPLRAMAAKWDTYTIFYRSEPISNQQV